MLSRFISVTSKQIYGYNKAILSLNNSCFYTTTVKNYNNITEIEKLRKRLLYQSKERGMLENDLLLGSFATKNINILSEKHLQEYDLLLQQPDPDIFNWALSKTEVPEEFNTELLKLLQYHCKNNPLGYNLDK
ncbi:DUF339 family protein [Tieghemostelium lacteum]|uniref:Succinate dehydrogenase assembly factor 2, mitochondrial n=1 Tax=Tieghemostelium lacteum TaxID=361077 RepID=A0A152A9K8_TIELA|nr:DUF339 family protein [Tieghemostelium lacteum]|eukprot:KYR02909.1 DUF339 family protein [Tieghemostelium lacteum]